MKKITALLLLVSLGVMAQKATVSEEIQQLDTYGFGTPNPVPILTENPKIFPYFKFEGYSHTSQKKGWKVVKLENEYIEVYVLPEIGGKVWGAIEKSTGNEFLYRNEVVKFRNISMRGPWTSGGIEFNFGIIGHHPSTATPVDYKIMENKDGSVSCVVGNLDLPSRTYWQVEIRLEKDKAYFETNASWYNGTPLNQSYYNWMTGAAPATNDLEFFIPGNGYLEHDGTWKKWPIDDKGRNLAMYENNNFGPSKSYHIVGDYKNYFGGYYHDSNVGFGHLSPYEEMPGQKLWLWALSRSGGIWEDLLTDTDGQYIEFQAGRLFNQYFPGAENPVSQANFEPHVMDTWQELWFPIKQIGGMEAASEYGVLNIERKGDNATLGINALQAFDEMLQILINGEEVSTENLQMKPMQVFEKTFNCKDSDTLEVFLGADKLQYTSVNKTLLKRDFVYDPEIKASEVEKLFHEASEAMKYREYNLANEKLSALLALNPSHSRALILLAEAEFIKTRYNKALEHVNTVLQLDTYNPGANYMAGIAYWAQGDALNAIESLGWAARSIQYRSVAYAQMAEIYLHENNLKKAATYAKKALAFNTYNLNARQVLLVAYRKWNKADTFNKQLDKVLKISRINHFASFEEIHFKNGATAAILDNIHNEFGNETILELALTYLNLGQDETAMELLGLNSEDSKSKLFLAYASKGKDAKKSITLINQLAQTSPNFVFPYRRESIPVLEWAVSINNDWKFKYYLAQNYLAVGLKDKAKELLEQCGDTPDNDAFYKFRAKTLDSASYESKLKDYDTALELNNNYWKNWDDLILFYLENGKNEEATSLGKKAVKKFPGNYNVGLSYAKSLVSTSSYSKAISVLDGLNILPFEHASESKSIYNAAHIYLAKRYMDKNQFGKAIGLLEASKKWPENLGIGTPYNPDERLSNYLLGICSESMGKPNEAKAYLENVVNHKGSNVTGVNTLFTLLALDKLGRKKDKDILVPKIEKRVKENSNAALIWALYNKETESVKASEKVDSRMLEILKYCIGR
ncbi:DUF5107 domain-containing protein [Flagellimonas pacifica]|uniref:DUF5107 domain-containing protein n=1 Tax=Flagellimonas pacifica TaxID=1247520 RepID=A0A285MHQ0_9FLAO|nr:DUF5107 domain-containing protein [Allomuricauda parva]SNY95486.1 protein of unknown function [Allomuricauda parva]